MSDNGRRLEIAGFPPGEEVKMRPHHFPLSAARRRFNWRRFAVRPVNDPVALQGYAQDAQAYIAALHAELERDECEAGLSPEAMAEVSAFKAVTANAAQSVSAAIERNVRPEPHTCGCCEAANAQIAVLRREFADLRGDYECALMTLAEIACGEGGDPREKAASALPWP